ncbi:MAG: collagen-like protein, partial [Deltaproteobacteria bacterium]|nr:collagen-like protein [Deltaproteobacteria bacterium]
MKRRGAPAALLVAAGAVLGTHSAQADVPALVMHQGRLYGAKDGKPIDGELSMLFAIYDSQITPTALWLETQQVSFENGYFSVALGSNLPFTEKTFEGAVRYLGITIGDDPEMAPRARIGSVPFALVADNATGDITPSSVTIPDYGTVIDSDGKWVGDPTGLVGPKGDTGPQGPAGP